MANCNKDLKKNADGHYSRFVGKNAKGKAEEFRLGTDQARAMERLSLIMKLWQYVEARPVEVIPHCLPYWSADLLGVAKAIA